VSRPAGALQRIVLMGFMGAGKSTVGRSVAAALDWPFVDLDEVIAGRAGVPVPRIFAEQGEARFRQMEEAAAREMLARWPLVLALGGGAIESDTIVKLLQETPATLSVFLHAPLPELLRRCAEDGGAAMRPLLAAPEALEARFARRLLRYQSAHLTIDTSEREPGEIAARIQQAVASWPRAHD
jgi:shikimate kinase